ncbi:HNH endonuclease signature motif containing protein [Neobacillus sp. SuZ13]|uniref:HNH endonuclease n=1 Tax=Neobacillus sp. SuZ13 TaxID=3047875 RepID=UPI0024C03463|nr:HNH endonuclease signature motif containing protein [Neobacillus sp. SuZ13]WHY65628.1 HNH endonuclease signature motif containing protein [Neobacillus sp. SuZ13]
MAIYNTFSDSANTSVRAFLTKVGEYYLGSVFNTGNGKGQQIWNDIKNNIFHEQCAYCGKTGKLQIEHLLMFNREECGLHHPGNIVPCCLNCNTRKKDSAGKYLSWQDHLVKICEENGDLPSVEKRKAKIKQHIEEGPYKYPALSDEEQKAIKVIAKRLYEHIKLENNKCLDLYTDLQSEFLK